MPRRQAASASGVQPPRLPAQLAVAPAQDLLGDHASFTRCVLEDCRFDDQAAEDLLLEQVLGRRVSFGQTQLALAQLLDVRLDACDLAGSEWSKPHARRVEWIGCRLIGVRLVEAQIEDLLVRKCNADLARLWSSTCRRVCFDQCTLREASFEGSDLSGAIFRRCDLSKADFRGTKLSRADFRGSTIAGMQVGVKELQGAIVDSAQAIQIAGLLGITVAEEE